MPVIIIRGGPLRGFTFHGPYATPEAAEPDMDAGDVTATLTEPLTPQDTAEALGPLCEDPRDFPRSDGGTFHQTCTRPVGHKGKHDNGLEGEDRIRW